MLLALLEILFYLFYLAVFCMAFFFVVYFFPSLHLLFLILPTGDEMMLIDGFDRYDMMDMAILLSKLA